MVGVDATSKQQEAIQKRGRTGSAFTESLCDGISDHVGGHSVHGTEEGNKD